MIALRACYSVTTRQFPVLCFFPQNKHFRPKNIKYMCGFVTRPTIVIYHQTSLTLNFLFQKRVINLS